jgi:hypothetical protein
MATISSGYANLLPPWYFKMTLCYIIHVLVLYQVDVFVCRFEKVTSQGPIKLKPKHHIDPNSLHDTLQSAVCITEPDIPQKPLFCVYITILFLNWTKTVVSFF